MTRSRASSTLLIPVPLLALSLVPLAAGTLRLVQLAGGPAAMPADDRFTGLPVALVAHILGAALYAALGAFQFLPRFRHRHLGWHRRAGRVLAAAGLVVVSSALWLTLGYAPQPGTGELLFALRLAFATAMATALVLGIRAVRAGDIATHRAWMIRDYAIGLGAGTQVFTQGVAEAAAGASPLVGDLAKGAGWVINLLVAEWVIHRSTLQSAGVRT